MFKQKLRADGLKYILQWKAADKDNCWQPKITVLTIVNLAADIIPLTNTLMYSEWN